MLTPRRKSSSYHHGDLKQAAVLAARNLVETEGLNALGIRRVAELAGVSPAALYRHFENLEQLRAELSAQVRSELAQFMAMRRDKSKISRSASRTALHRFQAIGEAYVDFARKHPRLFEIAFLHCDEQPLEDSSDEAWQVLNSSIIELDRAGLLEKQHKASAPMIAWSAVHGLASLVAQRALSLKDQTVAMQQISRGVERSILSKPILQRAQ